MEFKIALFGAVVGGGVSLAATLILQWFAELRTRRAVALSLIFRLINAIDDLGKIRDHVSDATTSSEGKDIDRNRLYERVTPIVGLNDIYLETNTEELSLFASAKHDKIFNNIVEIIRARNICIKTMVQYNNVRERLDEQLVSHGLFSQAGGKIQLSANINPAEHPEIIGTIVKANQLIEILFETSHGAIELCKNTVDQVNSVLPRCFPFWVKTQKIEFVNDN